MTLGIDRTYDLSLAVRKDWAPLAGILNKALATITKEERAAIYRRAGVLLSDLRGLRQRAVKGESQFSLPWIISIVIASLLLLIVIVLVRLRDRDPARLFGSPRA